MIQVVELCWTMIGLGIGDWPLVPRAEVGSVNRRGKRTCGGVHGFIKRATRRSFGRSKYGERVPVFAAAKAPSGSTDRKSTRLNSSHLGISYAVFCLKKKKKQHTTLNIMR